MKRKIRNFWFSGLASDLLKYRKFSKQISISWSIRNIFRVGFIILWARKVSCWNIKKYDARNFWFWKYNNFFILGARKFQFLNYKKFCNLGARISISWNIRHFFRVDVIYLFVLRLKSASGSPATRMIFFKTLYKKDNLQNCFCVTL